jgi:predicted O-linked N-acetylglucosamine transferase (SPINDLY family)
MSVREFEHLLGKAVGLAESGRGADAQHLLRQLTERFPAQSEPFRLLGVLALQRGDIASARAALRSAHELAPASAAILCNLGALARADGDEAAAESRYRQALESDPDCIPAHNNLAGLLFDRHRHEDAERHYRRALELAPDYVPARCNLSACLLTMDRGRDALAEAERAVGDAGTYPPAWLALARAQLATGLAEPARTAFERTAALGLRTADIFYGWAQASDEIGDWSESLLACERALRLDPAHAAAASLAQYLRRRLCRLDGLDAGRRGLLALLGTDVDGIAPFAFLSEEATPAQQRTVAEKAAADVLRRIAGDQQRIATVPSSTGKPRVGFVSSGFGQHPTALLIVDLIERLRENEIETIGYATTPDDGGELRRRLANAFTQLHDLSALSHTAMARRIASDRIDVLIDLRGWGGGSVADVFARQPAPIQVNWLAYPGTSGAPWIDYLLADRFVVPDDERAHYSEAVIRLPYCFQPSDTTRILIAPPSRTSFGLRDDDAPVFACFNNSYKYSPESLARFWRVLREVPGAQLWLLGGRLAEIHDNLRASARSAGIDPARVIFLPKQPHDIYLSCYAHADLFLDTTPYNAHTTASDALWAGCPVLTLPGRTFASRVAGSLNRALGLDELNADSDADFVAVAIRLGRDRAALTGLRHRLGAARRNSPLFDMPRFATDFTRAILMMVDRYRHGLAPADLDLAP